MLTYIFEIPTKLDVFYDIKNKVHPYNPYWNNNFKNMKNRLNFLFLNNLYFWIQYSQVTYISKTRGWYNNKQTIKDFYFYAFFLF